MPDLRQHLRHAVDWIITGAIIPHEVSGPSDDGAHVVKTIIHQHIKG